MGRKSGEKKRKGGRHFKNYRLKDPIVRM